MITLTGVAWLLAGVLAGTLSIAVANRNARRSRSPANWHTVFKQMHGALSQALRASTHAEFFKHYAHLLGLAWVWFKHQLSSLFTQLLVGGSVYLFATLTIGTDPVSFLFETSFSVSDLVFFVGAAMAYVGNKLIRVRQHVLQA